MNVNNLCHYFAISNKRYWDDFSSFFFCCCPLYLRIIFSLFVFDIWVEFIEAWSDKRKILFFWLFEAIVWYENKETAKKKCECMFQNVQWSMGVFGSRNFFYRLFCLSWNSILIHACGTMCKQNNEKYLHQSMILWLRWFLICSIKNKMAFVWKMRVCKMNEFDSLNSAIDRTLVNNRNMMHIYAILSFKSGDL